MRHTQLLTYDSVFMRGISIFLEGAEIDRRLTNGFRMKLSPVGQSTVQTHWKAWSNDAECVNLIRDNPFDQCTRWNETYVGAPIGHRQVIECVAMHARPNKAPLARPLHSPWRMPA